MEAIVKLKPDVKSRSLQVLFTGSLTSTYATKIHQELDKIEFEKYETLIMSIQNSDIIDLSFLQILWAFTEHCKTLNIELSLNSEIAEEQLQLIEVTGLKPLIEL
ncbi:hypothetical protein [Fulvivirga ligni]|uniref:hypothetical protein n=1 Tax=Fulvivirga ligni TaxID=2904246 RepID=UPI001F3C8968|nr:hypothetical protein [Fulvivirga ligni]UII20766.1 hypothetical protein LVD16_23270 [Fulvivirga ligni]